VYEEDDLVVMEAAMAPLAQDLAVKIADMVLPRRG